MSARGKIGSGFSRSRRGRRAGFAVAWTLALAAAGGCAGMREPPLLLPLREKPDKQPVVLVPGMTGTRLREVESGRLVWGDTRSLFRPRDGGYALALPVASDRNAPRRIEAAGPILELRLLGLYRKPIYGPLLKLMQRHGYRLGDLRRPQAEETFFVLDYDWRRGVENAVRELDRRLEALREARGESRLRVTLICQSNAGLIGRYYARYGAASLEEAEAGRAAPPERIVVEKMILAGTSNGGALRVLREMNRGRTYVPWVGRRWRPETLFTFPTLYENLPAYLETAFFDERGEPIAVDLFDPASWERYGWSVFAEPVWRRLSRLDPGGVFGDEASRRRFLERNLDRARRLHRLLREDTAAPGETRYYSLQNAYLKSAERALLLRRGGRWQTIFDDRRRVRGDPYLRSLAASPGDGHATLRSQAWLAPQETAAMARPPDYFEGGHFEMILHPGAQRRIVEYLLDEGLGSGRPATSAPAAAQR